MWEFSNLNSGSMLWPPDAGQQQNSYPMVYPASANPYGCLFSGTESVPFPGFGAQGSFLQFNSTFLPPLNPPALTPGSKYTIPEGANAHVKKFLVFDHSGDHTSMVFSSVANPFEVLNMAPQPGGNATYLYASNNHVIAEEEVHEDTEDIDALLYSDSEFLYDEEEASTGHSPSDLEVEEVASSHIPAKRRRVDSTELDASLTDTANSAIAPCPCYKPEADHIELSFVNSIGIREGKPGGGGRRRCSKRERIKSTVSVLRRIIPGGKGKDTASVLDEAIRYLKSLKLRAKTLGATTLTL